MEAQSKVQAGPGVASGSIDAPGTGSAPRAASSWVRHILPRFELASVLRIFGAGVMIAAIGIFLFQRWEAGNDLFRYSLLLTQTVILSLLGFAISRWLREPKSARVFLSLGLVSNAACFAILGALLYSTTQWDTLSTVYPGFAFWQADSLTTALAWIAGSMMALAPLSLIGFTVLARPAARRLSVLFLSNGLLLLIPFRDPAATTAIAVLAAVLGFLVLARMAHHAAALRTLEGRLARTICLLPALIMAGRSGCLYAADAVTVLSYCVLVYVVLRQLAISAQGRRVLARSLEALSLPPALLGAMAVVDVVTRLVGSRWDLEMALAAFCLVLAGSLVDLSRRSLADARLYASLAGLVVLAGGMVELALEPSTTTATLAVVLSGAVAFYARGTGLLFLYWLSALCLLTGLGYQVRFAIDAFDLGGWMGLAVVGVIAIVLAAALERHGSRIKALARGTFHIPSHG